MAASGDGEEPQALGRLREQRLQRERSGAGLPVAWGGEGSQSPKERAALCIQCALRVWRAKKRYCDLLFQEVTREEEEFRRHQEEQCREAEAILRQEQLHRCQSDQEILERHEHRVRNVAAHRIQWAFRRRRQLRAIVRIQRMFRRQRTCLRRRARRPMRAWPADTGRPAPPARASPARPASEHKRGGPAPAGSLHAARVPSIEELSNRIGTLGREELSRCSLPVLQQTLVAAQQRQHELSEKVVRALKRREALREESELVAVGIRQSLEAAAATRTARFSPAPLRAPASRASARRRDRAASTGSGGGGGAPTSRRRAVSVSQPGARAAGGREWRRQQAVAEAQRRLQQRYFDTL